MGDDAWQIRKRLSGGDGELFSSGLAVKLFGNNMYYFRCLTLMFRLWSEKEYFRFSNNKFVIQGNE